MKYLLLALVLAGCVSDRAREWGKIDAVDRESSSLIAAPYGDFDKGTSEIVKAACAQLRWDCLVATGYRTESRPLAVNRPIERGPASQADEFSDAAGDVYEYYNEKVDEIRGEPLALYVEVLGEGRDASGRFTVTLSGKAKEQQAAISKILKEEWGKGGELGSSLVVLAAPEEGGTFGRVQAGLRFHVPREYRGSRREKTILFFASALKRIEKDVFKVTSLE